eukprot:TRINITY_DN863_c0_g1_i1.p1 TRINITY_DN863_c0_g1~~TRINITY_DN863_c0_g1_i1.p1  ORF type:complete len:724 (+),score=230.88 TRINITY_DN863_c0_g1_i1:147-2318(+)
MSYKNAHEIKKQCGEVHRFVVNIVDNVSNAHQLVQATKDLTTVIEEMKKTARALSETVLSEQGKLLPFALVLIKGRREQIKNRLKDDTASRVKGAREGIEKQLEVIRELATESLEHTKTETMTGASDNVTTTLSFSSPSSPAPVSASSSTSPSSPSSSISGASDNVTTTLSFNTPSTASESKPAPAPAATPTPAPAPAPVVSKPTPAPTPAPVAVAAVKKEPAPEAKPSPASKPAVEEETVTLNLAAPTPAPTKVAKAELAPQKAEPKPAVEVTKPAAAKVTKAEPKKEVKPAQSNLNPQKTGKVSASPHKTVNSLGTALTGKVGSTSGRKGGRRISGVRTLTVTLAATGEAVSACDAAKTDSTTRAIFLTVEKEELQLEKVIEKSGTPLSDFQTMVDALPAKKAVYVLYRYKDEVTNGQWDYVFITWLPEGSPVRQRMVYSSGVSSTAVMIGEGRIGKYKTYNTKDQVVLSDFTEVGSNIKNKQDFLSEDNDASLPFSERELAQRQVEREERQARKELSNKAVKASGFHSVAFPLDAAAEKALGELKEGVHTWVQLSLDSKFKTIIFKKAESPSSVAELPGLLHTSEPQFYVYIYKDDTPILIYHCPEKGPTIKNKMVYSTAKAPLTETILSLGFNACKKLDTRDPKEDLTEEELNDAYAAKKFTPSQVMGSSGGSVGSRGQKSGPGRYGAPMGGLGGLAGLVAAGANSQKRSPFRPPPGAY